MWGSGRKLFLVVCAGSLVLIGGAANASAAVTASGATSTGQVLTVTIDTPADGATTPTGPTVAFTGHTSVSPSANKNKRTEVWYTAVNTSGPGVAGDVMTADGTGAWHGDSWIGAGWKTVYANAYAKDGTLVSASISIYVPARASHTVAYPLLASGGRTGAVPGEMQAQIAIDDWPYIAGNTVWFATDAQPQAVCWAFTDANGVATCTDTTWNQEALQVGGFSAGYGGETAGPTSDPSQIITGSEDHATLTDT